MINLYAYLTPQKNKSISAVGETCVAIISGVITCDTDTEVDEICDVTNALDKTCVVSDGTGVLDNTCDVVNSDEAVGVIANDTRVFDIADGTTDDIGTASVLDRL